MLATSVWTVGVQTIKLTFFLNDTATTEIYTLSLHDALPICVEQFEHAFLGRKPAGIEHLGRLGLVADAIGQFDAARDDTHVTCTKDACAFGKVVRGGDHQPCSTKHATRKPGRATSKLHVGTPHLNDVGLAAPCSNPAGGEPVRVQEIGIHPARCADET